MANIRIATVDDAAAIASIYAPYVRNTAISFEEVVPTVEDMRSRIMQVLGAYPYLVAEEEGRIVAYAYAGPHGERAAYRWSANVAIYADSMFHRRGLGRALYVRLFRILERQRIHSIFAGITLPNAKSIGLHEAMGLTPVGTYRQVGFKFGQWHDVGWWGHALCEEPPDGEPIAFPAIAKEAMADLV